MIISDHIIELEKVPLIEPNSILKTALEEMVNKNLGIACIVESDFTLRGVVTDGDLRRTLLTSQRPLASIFMDNAIDHAIKSPITVSADTSLKDALITMYEKQIWDLPVLSGQSLLGLFHLHSATKLLLDGL